MTTEELLKPRWILVINYPGNILNIGTILSEISDYVLLPGSYGPQIWYKLRDFPQIFRSLEWWEHRDPKDLPKYIKSSATQNIYEVQEYLLKEKIYLTPNGFHHVLQTTEPSTEQEFLSQ